LASLTRITAKWATTNFCPKPTAESLLSFFNFNSSLLPLPGLRPGPWFHKIQIRRLHRYLTNLINPGICYTITMFVELICRRSNQFPRSPHSRASLGAHLAPNERGPFRDRLRFLILGIGRIFPAENKRKLSRSYPKRFRDGWRNACW